MLRVVDLADYVEPKYVFGLQIPPLLDVDFPDLGRTPLFWRVSSSNSRTLLYIRIDPKHGRLTDISCPGVDRNSTTFVESSFVFLAEGAKKSPVFDVSAWQEQPDVYPRTVSEDLPIHLRVGAAAFSLQLGEEQAIGEILELGQLRLGLNQERELVRIDVLDIEADYMEELREYLDHHGGTLAAPAVTERITRWLKVNFSPAVRRDIRDRRERTARRLAARAKDAHTDGDASCAEGANYDWLVVHLREGRPLLERMPIREDAEEIRLFDGAYRREPGRPFADFYWWLRETNWEIVGVGFRPVDLTTFLLRSAAAADYSGVGGAAATLYFGESRDFAEGRNRGVELRPCSLWRSKAGRVACALPLLTEDFRKIEGGQWVGGQP